VNRRFHPSNALASCQPPNQQLERIVKLHRGVVASAPFHYALAPRFARQRAAAQLQRSATTEGSGAFAHAAV
jgi:hypothetical protein